MPGIVYYIPDDRPFNELEQIFKQEVFNRTNNQHPPLHFGEIRPSYFYRIQREIEDEIPAVEEPEEIFGIELENYLHQKKRRSGKTRRFRKAKPALDKKLEENLISQVNQVVEKIEEQLDSLQYIDVEEDRSAKYQALLDFVSHRRSYFLTFVKLSFPPNYKSQFVNYINNELRL
jgi:hypothetical protein